MMADINGDGRADVVGFGTGGTLVALGQANGSFGPMTKVNSDFGAGLQAGGWSGQDRYTRLLGDVNGDGRADIVGFGENGTLVALANANGGFGSMFVAGNAFGAGANAGGWSSQNLYGRTLGDVNGDGRADIIGFGTTGTFVALANANGTFGAMAQASVEFGRAPAAGGWETHDRYPRMVADVNGDGRADIVGFGDTAAYVAYGQANGTFGAMTKLVDGAFGASPSAGGWESQNKYPRLMADVNGDGRADIVGFGTGGTYYALNNGQGGFGAFTLGSNQFGAGAQAGGWNDNNLFPRMMADLNGDKLADIVGFGSSGVHVTLAEGFEAAPAAAAFANEPSAVIHQDAAFFSMPLHAHDPLTGAPDTF
jgi:hypothetical protein